MEKLKEILEFVYKNPVDTMLWSLVPILSAAGLYCGIKAVQTYRNINKKYWGRLQEEKFHKGKKEYE